MNIDWSEWGPPLGVLVAGILAGAFLVSRSQAAPSDPGSVTKEGELADLEMRHQQAVQALKDLEMEKDKLSADDYARERQALLARGSDALRRLDAARQAAPAPAPAGPAARAAWSLAEGPGLSPAALAVLDVEKQRLGEEAFARAVLSATGVNPAAVKPAPAAPSGIAPEWKGALYMLAVVLVVASLGYFASGDSQTRREGGSMTGNQDLASDAPQRDDAEKQALIAQLETNPNDIEALNRLTVIALSEQDASTAMQYNERALSVAPNDLDARTYRGVLSAMMGMMDKAMETFDGVLAENPEHAMALVYKGLIAVEAGKPDVAIPALEKAIAVGAANPEFLQQQLAMAKSMQAGGAPATEGGTPAPAGADAVVFSAKVNVDPAVADAASGAKAFFVSVKDPSGGPPIAAKRMAPGPFPMDLTITEADKLPMMGDRPVPAVVDVTLRLDFDGNASSRSDGEPIAEFKGLSKGTTGLEATLK
jgi:tetratricopeptide (TPR) repeat protein